ncbi:hypothetical protein LCGC14_0208610 [marine sediment metagenome]|uniref:Uncharacterized protein n=1 Tax=marine sediment metagenome TaxID=412755 RepID=A0A0F9UGN3_9ZZZZ
MSEVDLVARLRDHNRSFNCVSEEGGECWQCEAADEVERLRGNNGALGESVTDAIESFLDEQKETTRLRAENAKLVEALGDLVEYVEGSLSYMTNDEHPQDKARRLAVAAETERAASVNSWSVECPTCNKGVGYACYGNGDHDTRWRAAIRKPVATDEGGDEGEHDDN